jgi:hypothetical protein
MTLVRDDSDLDGLDAATRARRLRIRREIEESLKPETWYDKEIREKTEARKRVELEQREAKERETKQSVERTASWADWVDGRIMAVLTPFAESVAPAVGAVFGEHRRQRQAELAEESQRLIKRVEEMIAKAEERANDARAGLDHDRLSRIEDSIEEIREQLRGEFEMRAEKEGADRRNEVTKAVAELRCESGQKLLALRERTIDALESRPVFDQGQADRAVADTVARTRVERVRNSNARSMHYGANSRRSRARPTRGSPR